MKTRFLTSALIAATAAGALAAPTISSAQTRYYYDDCRGHSRNDGTAGAVIGGIAGALLGSSVAPHHGNRAGAAAIGGVTGAVIGSQIGRSSSRSGCYDQGYYRHGRSYSYDSRDYGYSSPTYYYRGNGYDDGRYGYNTYYAPTYSYPSRSYYYPY